MKTHIEHEINKLREDLLAAAKILQDPSEEAETMEQQS